MGLVMPSVLLVSSLLLLVLSLFRCCCSAAFTGGETAVNGNGGGIGQQQPQQPFITSVSYLFEAFSPYALLRFFEFSDKGWHISEHCLKDMYSYMEGLRREALWAVKLYDASGYYGGGIFGGDVASHLRMQDANACRQLQEQHERIAWRLPRKWYWNATVVPFPVHIIMAHYELELLEGGGAGGGAGGGVVGADGIEGAYRVHRLQQLICFPQTCSSSDDLQQILELYGLPPSPVVRNGTYVRHRIVADDYVAFEDRNFYLLVTLFCGSFCLYAAVHLLRVYLSLCNRSTQANASGWSTIDGIGIGGIGGIGAGGVSGIGGFLQQMFNNKEKGLTLPSQLPLPEPPPAAPLTPVLPPLKSPLPMPLPLPPIVRRSRLQSLEDLLDACSVQSVLYTLLLADDAPQSGLLVAFTSLMIYAHLAAELSFLRSAGDGEQQSRHFVTRNASYLIDIYFFVQASKLAQQFGQPSAKPKQKLNVCNQLKRVLRILLKKLLNLLPSYTFCLYAEHLIIKHFQHNVAMELPTAGAPMASSQQRMCHEHKWSALLYLDTFYPLHERCMPWTWFISLEMQFCVIACLILLLAGIHKHYAAIIGCAIFGISLLAATLWHVQALRIVPWSIDAALRQFYVIDENAMQRVPAYLLGLALGHLLRKRSNVQLNGVLLIVGWLLYAVVVGVGLWSYNNTWLWMRAGALTHAFLHTITHVLWALLIFWLLLTALSQYGGWLFELLSFRHSHTLELLSPICLLIAPSLIRLLIFAGDVPFQASATQILFLAIGCWLFTYVVAFVLHVALDGPLQAFVAEMLSQQ